MALAARRFASARPAPALELSTEGVKQRLSRGRKLLKMEVEAFVEIALRQSAPGRKFTSNVLAGLPILAMPAGASALGACRIQRIYRCQIRFLARRHRRNASADFRSTQRISQLGRYRQKRPITTRKISMDKSDGDLLLYFCQWMAAFGSVITNSFLS